MNLFTNLSIGDIVETTEEFRNTMEEMNKEQENEGIGFYYHVPYHTGKITDIEIKWINEPEYSVKGFLVLATLDSKIGQMHVKWLKLKDA